MGIVRKKTDMIEIAQDLFIGSLSPPKPGKITLQAANIPNDNNKEAIIFVGMFSYQFEEVLKENGLEMSQTLTQIMQYAFI